MERHSKVGLATGAIDKGSFREHLTARTPDAWT
jgi:hypothetical protein